MADKYGFVYLWFDRKRRRYYVGCHWGNINDGYICSSKWMRDAYIYRPQDFKRRILKSNIPSRFELFEEELRWLNMIKESEIKPHNPNPRYYNLSLGDNSLWHKYEDHIKTVGQKISAAKKGKNTGPRSPEVGRRISEAKQKKKLERLALGLPLYHMSDAVKAANLARRGSKHTDETREKMSKSHLEHWSTHQHHNSGRKLSDTHKLNISNGLKKSERYN